MKLAITRVRNEEIIIGSTINRLKDEGFDGLVAFDDASDDYTVDILRSDPFVKWVIQNKSWTPNPLKRMELETTQRQYLFDYANEIFKPKWMLYLDADEHIYLNNIDWDSQHSYFFRLFDVYITPDDVNSHFLDRNMIGCEYRDIPMLFRPHKNIKFYNRLPKNINQPVYFGGYVKHFGKGISVDHWEETCDYYINNLYEKGKHGELISDKWKKRKGKAIHTKNDFGDPLIRWEDRGNKSLIKRI